MKRKTFRHAYFLFFFLLMLPIVYPIRADAGWSNLGLYGGQIYSIAMDKDNPSKLFAGAYYGGGLFRTDDGGLNWTPVTTGAEGTGFDGEATFSNTAVWGVEIAPTDSNVVWAVHNYWAEKSTDGGNTWTHILNSTMQGSQFRWCKSLAIDPFFPDTVYVGAAGYNTDTLSYGTIFKTTDGGTTWTSIGPGTGTGNYDSYGSKFPYPVVAIEIDPQYNGHILAISASGEGSGAVSYVYRSTDGGTTWTQIGDNPFYGGLKDIKVKPDDYNTVIVAGYNGIGKFVFTTYSYTYSWIYQASGADVRALASQPGNTSRLYAAGRKSYLGIIQGIGPGVSWVNIGYQLLTLALEPYVPSGDVVVYGGELHKGIIRGVYTTEGAWSPSERNTGVNAIQVWDVAVDPNNKDHYLVATEAGVYEKASAASVWTKRGTFDYTSAYSVAFDPGGANTYYAGAEGRLYKTTDGGATWPSSVSLSGYVTGIAVTPGGSNNLYVTTRHTSYTSYGYVYRIPKDLSLATSIKPSGNFDYNTVAIDPNDPGYDRIFVGGGNYFGTNVPGKIYETTNANASPPVWTERLSSVIVNALLIDPNNSNNIYAGVGWAGGTEIPLYKSTDGGVNWQKSYQGIPGGPSRYGIWGSSASNIYVLRHTGSIPKGGTDDGYMIRYQSSWTKAETGVSTPLYGIWGYDSSNIFAVGQSGTVVRYNGSVWTSWQLGSFDLHDVWGSSGANVFAVGTGGTIYRFGPDKFGQLRWFASASPTGEDLHGIWGYSGTDIYAVGSSGVILHYTGSWSEMTSPVTERLEDVWGSSSANIFAVGSARLDGSTRYYTILRWNDSSWTIMSTPSVPAGKSGRLRSVWGSSGSDVYAVGDDGVALRYDGSTWAAMSSGTSDPLYGVWGTASNNVYAVGLFGTIIKFNGTSWSAVDTSGDIPGEKTGLWNAVTDLAFSPEGHIYAATNRQGIYASANGAKSWINMSAPPYTVYAVAAGSVISGGSAGTHSLSGEGLLNGYVSDMNLGTGLYDARVQTDVQGGRSTTTEADGSWAMLHPAGTYNLTASKSGYLPKTELSVPVYDGTWTDVTLGLSCVTCTLTVASTNPASGVSITVGPNDNSGLGSGTTQFTRTYNNGASVTLTAPSTAGGNNFSSWTGCNSATGTTCTVTMDAAKMVMVTYARNPYSDFNGDSKPDILWRNTSTGMNAVWYMNGSQYLGESFLGSVADQAWRMVGTADFNGDGKVDILWRNTSTGANAIWYMNGTQFLGDAFLNTVTDQTWRMVGTADFNGDGKPDILWRNTSTGQNAVWYMNGAQYLGEAFLNTVTDQAWKIVGTGDFNGDGKTDILWRNTSTGQNAAWYMNGSQYQGEAFLSTVTDQTWKIVGTGDVNGDGKVDILWRNASIGINAIWYMNGVQYLGEAFLNSVSDQDWEIVGGQNNYPTTGDITNDFNNDGKPDILWRNTSTGQNAIWYMNGAQFLGDAFLNTVSDQNWKMVGTGDFNSDDKPDILWRNTSTGANAVWYMDGAQYLGDAFLNTVTDQTWKMVGTADFNSDAKPDILWRNTSTGANAIWYMNGTQFLGDAFLNMVTDQNWKMVGTADFNGDGKPDILWRNTSTGVNAIWYMNGTQYLGDAFLNTLTDQNWKMVGAADFNGDGKPDILWRNTSTGANAIWYMNGTQYLGDAFLNTLTDQNWKMMGQ